MNNIYITYVYNTNNNKSKQYNNMNSLYNCSFRSRSSCGQPDCAMGEVGNHWGEPGRCLAMGDQEGMGQNLWLGPQILDDFSLFSVLTSLLLD